MPARWIKATHALGGPLIERLRPVAREFLDVMTRREWIRKRSAVLV